MRKEVVFIDKLGKVLGSAETSTQFIPYLTKFKRKEAGDDEQLENEVEHREKENDSIKNAFGSVSINGSCLNIF